ncbi:MAG: 50S ribosomal protein L33 [Myxococcales bacterium]|nr:50S ribosomal protein L33 [Myxococcales bacterium]
MPKGDQIRVNLECTICTTRNYTVKKNRRSVPAHFSIKKFCSTCGRHTEHRMGK